MENTIGLYKFEIHIHRMGTLLGIFIEGAKNIQNAYGQHVTFNECFGKHSSVTVTLDSDTIQLITEDPHVLDIVRTHGLMSGEDPIEIMRNSDEGYQKIYETLPPREAQTKMVIGLDVFVQDATMNAINMTPKKVTGVFYLDPNESFYSAEIVAVGKLEP